MFLQFLVVSSALWFPDFECKDNGKHANTSFLHFRQFPTVPGALWFRDLDCTSDGKDRKKSLKHFHQFQTVSGASWFRDFDSETNDFFKKLKYPPIPAVSNSFQGFVLS